MIIDSERNRAAYLQMLEVIRDGHSIAFAGAGVTFPLGYPTWPKLVDLLAAEVRRLRGEQLESNGQAISVEKVLRDLKGEPLVQAQILKENLKGDYFPLMASLFGPKGGRAASVADLVSLPFKHFLTSNYDPGLEQHHVPSTFESICLHHEESAAQFIFHHSDSGYAKRIVHVHGRYDEPERIILTEGDYGIYVRSPLFDQFWRTLPVAMRLVFFGFSCEDIDLLYGFRRVRMALGGNNQHVESRHFAVMDLADASQESATALKLKMRYGIDPVFYPNPKKDFAEYGNFIAELKRDACGPPLERLGEQIVVEAIAPVQAQPAAQPPAEVVLQAVDRLRQITRENLGRRQTGDLQ